MKHILDAILKATFIFTMGFSVVGALLCILLMIQ